MKRALRFGILVGVLAVTSWVSMGREAQALPACSFLANRACSPKGARQDCIDPWGPGVCVCNTSLHWTCMV